MTDAMYVYSAHEPPTPERLAEVARRLEGLGEMWRQEFWAVREAAEAYGLLLAYVCHVEQEGADLDCDTCPYLEALPAWMKERIVGND